MSYIVGLVLSMVPIVEYLEGGWAHYSWSPFGLFTAEGLICPEITMLLRALCVLLPMLLIAWTIQRWDDHARKPRHK